MKDRLNMLDFNDSDYYEREEKVLDMLPRTLSGLQELTKYIVIYDSHAAYKKLLEDFREFLSEDHREQYLTRTRSIFDKKLVQEWIR